jgi:hypothetical protein
MRATLVLLLSFAVAVAGCGTTAPSDQASPAAAGELYLVTYVDGPEPGFGVRVDAVDPSGRSRVAATVPSILPEGWDDAQPSSTLQPSVGPTGWLVVGAERNGGFEDADVRTMLLDLSGSGHPPVEVARPMYQPFWGPNGELATLDGDPIVVDPVTGGRRDLPRQDRIEIAPAWLRDESGWLANRIETDGTTAGSVDTNGRFTPGAAPAFEVTGRERMTGAAGGSLSLSISEGATGSETAIAESRPGLPGACECLIWVRSVEPGDAPSFGEPVWDHDGTGFWVVFSDEDSQWLSHMTAPLKESKVADLPKDASWRIEGISADDRWVVLGDFNGGGPLLLVETASGESRILARPDVAGNVPSFAGWVR